MTNTIFFHQVNRDYWSASTSPTETPRPSTAGDEGSATIVEASSLSSTVTAPDYDLSGKLRTSHLKKFSFKELKIATSNFENRLGEGGFGPVFKGWIHGNKLTGSKQPGKGIPVATICSLISDVSSAGSEEKQISKQGIYASSYNSTKTTEPGTLKFTIEEIYKATKNFSPSLKIGQGGVGTVYKGRLADGTLVAIKRAKKNVYDKHLGVEFQSEIQMLARVEHLNLVRFHGYLEHKEEKIVVVEYVPNGTLREHLDCLSGNVLDLAARLNIAIDVAHAVTYLHMYADHPIIHRDIKSSNILLTDNLRAKVADFRFATLAADSDNGATQVKGTAGYLDPEYLRTYQLTEKSDVYSFGVLLVELVSGRHPIEPKRDIKERITAR